MACINMFGRSFNFRPSLKGFNIRLIGWILIIAAFGCPAEEIIPSNYRTIAQDFGIPASVLYAVALNESQLKLKNSSIRPWPWTLNVQGVPKRYPTRIAAWKSLEFYLKQGIDLIDVGLLQVNWHYHRRKLGSTWEALDPFHNAKVGAQILKQHYRQSGDWSEAIGRYHSPGPKPEQKQRARQYAARALKHLKKLNQSALALNKTQTE